MIFYTNKFRSLTIGDYEWSGGLASLYPVVLHLHLYDNM